jgi:hypothetical protein
MQQVAPCQRSQENKCEADDDAVAPEHGRRGSHEIDDLATDPGIPKLLRDTGGFRIGLLTDHRPSPIVGVRCLMGDRHEL